MMFHPDSFADSLGRLTTQRANALLELSTGSDSIHMNMLETPSDWLLLPLLIDAILP